MDLEMMRMRGRHGIEGKKGAPPNSSRFRIRDSDSGFCMHFALRRLLFIVHWKYMVVKYGTVSAALSS